MNQLFFDTANIISRSLNTLVNPCDDFYEFACGGFISKMDVPRSSLGINSFSIIKELTFNQIKEILSEDIQSNEIKPFRMAKQFYKDCLDEGRPFHITYTSSRYLRNDCYFSKQTLSCQLDFLP